MRKYLILTASFFLLVFSFLSFSMKENDITTDECHLKNSVFKGGEKLEYTIYYNLGLVWIPAGEAIFSVKETNIDYEIKVTGKTFKGYENIFKVNDYFYSKIDKKTMHPKSFIRNVEEGSYRLYDSIAFDQSRNVAVTFYGKTKATTRSQVHFLNSCTQDLVSNMYYMRNLKTESLNKGDQFLVSMFFDKEMLPINVRVGGKETKNIKGIGKFNTILIIPDLVKGNVFQEGDQMKMWVSDDNNKIPLLIESPVSVGSIKAILKSHSGLKYALDAEIKD